MNWSIVWVIMRRRGYPQNAGVLVVLVDIEQRGFQFFGEKQISFLNLTANFFSQICIYMDLISSACRCVRETLPHSSEAVQQKCIHSNMAVVDHTFYCADKDLCR